jgi:hypothetical protein
MILVFVLLIGCSGGGGPTLPDNQQAEDSLNAQSASNRVIWGLYEVRIGEDRSDVSITTVRNPEFHINATRLLEETCGDCLRVENLQPISPTAIELDLVLEHPYGGNNKAAAFDVRGILIAGSDKEFPDSGMRIAWGSEHPSILGPDGFTTLFNPAEFGEGSGLPELLQYYHGKYAGDGNFDSTLNPFVAFGKDNEKRVFVPGTEERERIRIYTPPGEVSFGYAIDASWISVDYPIYTIPDDFPPEANSIEPYAIRTEINSWQEQGLQVTIGIEVKDHQTPESIAGVTIEAPDIFSGTINAILQYTEGESAYYTATFTNQTGAMLGEYPILVRAISATADQQIGQVDAYQVITGKEILLDKASVREYGTIEVSIGVFEGGDISYEWKVEPQFAGKFINIDQNSAELKVRGVDRDKEIELSCTIWNGSDIEFEDSVRVKVEDVIETVPNFWEMDYLPLEFVSMSGNTATYAHNGLIPEFEAGDYLVGVSYDDEGKINQDQLGFIGTIIGYEETTSYVVIEYEPTTLNNIIVDGAISALMDGSDGHSGDVWRRGEGVLDEQFTFEPIELHLITDILGTDELFSNEDLTIKLTEDRVLIAPVIDFYVEYEFDGISGEVQQLIMKAYGEVDYDLEVTVEGEATLNYEDDYPPVKVLALPFNILFIPALLEVQVYFGWDATVDIRGTVVGGLDVDNDIFVGAKAELAGDDYDFTKLEPEWESEIVSYVDASADCSVDVNAWVKPEISLSIITFLLNSRGTIDVKGNVRFDGDGYWELGPPEDWCFEYGFFAGVESMASLQFDVLGIHVFEENKPIYGPVEWPLCEPIPEIGFEGLGCDPIGTCGDVVDPPECPIAYTTSGGIVYVGEEMCFENLSTDVNDDIVLVEWDPDFDNPNGPFTQDPDYTNVNDPCFIFDEQGIYYVQLRVTDSTGCQDMLDGARVVEVLPLPCDTTVSQINGPPVVQEEECEQYSISISGQYNSIQWSVNPPGSGYFTNPEGELTQFCANELDEDMQAEISVTVTVDNCPVFEKQKGITILDDEEPNDCPVAGAEADHDQAIIGEVINFTSTSYDPDGIGDIVLYEWDFNYGGQIFDVDATGPNVSHAYDWDADFIINLRVTDSEGCVDYINNGGHPQVHIDPISPPELIKTITIEYAVQIATIDGYAFILDGNNGVYVVDIEPASSAHIVGFIPEYWLDSLDADGDLLIVEGDYMTAYDISDPANPVQTDREPAEVVADHIKISNGIGYEAAGQYGLATWDFTDPYDIKFLQKTLSPNSARGVDVVGDLAYVIDSGGMHIFNVSDPAHPVDISNEQTCNGGHDIKVVGDYAYNSALPVDMAIRNVSDPYNPFCVVSYMYPFWTGNGRSIDLVNHYALVTTSGGAEFKIIDISNPTEPEGIFAYPLEYMGYDVEAQGTVAVVAAGFGGVLIYDISSLK